MSHFESELRIGMRPEQACCNGLRIYAHIHCCQYCLMTLHSKSSGGSYIYMWNTGFVNCTLRCHRRIVWYLLILILFGTILLPLNFEICSSRQLHHRAWEATFRIRVIVVGIHLDWNFVLNLITVQLKWYSIHEISLPEAARWNK